MSLLSRFWNWYERRHRLNISITALLFVWQLVHLYWLTSDVVVERLFGWSFFNPSELWTILLILVDYTEIPALISASVLYISLLRKKFTWKSVLFLIFLNSQWLHLFWITDEFVVEQLTGAPGVSVLPIWLAWFAIFIDYLELPIIYDTLRQFFRNIASKPDKTDL